jgi:hypothetical protein
MMATDLLSWADLSTAEPRLLPLEADVRAERPGVDGAYCANARWYGPGGFKGRYRRLVGLNRNAPPRRLLELRPDPDRDARRRRDEAAGLGWLWSSAAYDAGYLHLYALLPDCAYCACSRMGDP